MAAGIEGYTRPQEVGIDPRVEGTRLQGIERPLEKEEGTHLQGVECPLEKEEGTHLQGVECPLEKEGTAPQEAGIVQAQANLGAVGNVLEVQANLWAPGRILESQVQLRQPGRLEWRVHQQGAGTGPQGVGIGRMEPQGVDTDQGVDIDQGAGNSLDKHIAEAAGSIGLAAGNIQVVLVVHHILLGVSSRAVGQAHQGVGRALDLLEAS